DESRGDAGRLRRSPASSDASPGATMAPPIDLRAKLAAFEGHWQPRTVCEYNGHDVMVVKIEGEYHWHSHPDTDDFFLVLDGEIEIDLEGGKSVRQEEVVRVRMRVPVVLAL